MAREVDDKNEVSLLKRNFWAMSTFDWCTLVLAATFISMASFGENKDAVLCSIMIDQAQDVSSVRSAVLKLVGGVRRWTFIPGMLVAVVNLVAIQGGVSRVLHQSAFSQRCTHDAVAQRPYSLVSICRLTCCAGFTTVEKRLRINLGCFVSVSQHGGCFISLRHRQLRI